MKTLKIFLAKKKEKELKVEIRWYDFLKTKDMYIIDLGRTQLNLTQKILIFVHVMKGDWNLSQNIMYVPSTCKKLQKKKRFKNYHNIHYGGNNT